MRKTVWMPIVALVLASVILLAGYNLSAGYRQARIEEELTAKMQTILPGSTVFAQEDYTGGDANIRSVHKGEKGFVIETVTYGYAGEITMFIGVTNEGKVSGLVVRDLQETYGLGREALTNVDFLKQFLNQGGSFAVATSGADAFSGATATAESADDGIEVDALTGATVTSKAIVRCVNSAVAYVTGADAATEATSWGG